MLHLLLPSLHVRFPLSLSLFFFPDTLLRECHGPLELTADRHLAAAEAQAERPLLASNLLKRPPIREDLKVMLYQSQEADNTFITSDGTTPYNSMR
jgi:hypothetical protein